MFDEFTTPDRFAKDMGEILGQFGQQVERKIPDAAERAARHGVERMPSHIAWAGIGGTGRYARSWGYRQGRKGQESFVEMGSSMPGLPHLLEKGHATIGGGRVAGRMHVAHDAEEVFENFERDLREGLEDIG